MSGTRTTFDVKGVTARPWEFLAVFLVTFFLASVFLFAIDFVPEKNADASSEGAASAQTQNIATHVESPVRIAIASIGVNTPVENPASKDATVLDNALLKGAVRYPDSGLLGENARMFIFGHQSYLPVVHNQAFKAFNGLQKLKTGEDITVYSATTAYHYRVTDVEHKEASDASIPLGSGARTLTLSTCDSFGEKTERWVVTAEFVSQELIK